MIDLWTADVLKIDTALGGKMRLVGGCVRDFILHRKPKDVDIATPLPAKQVVSFLEKNKIQARLVYPEYGVSEALIGMCRYEITTLREDVVLSNGTVANRPTESYETDAYRRDFTINALSMDKNGTIYDYQNGLEDLKNRRIRFIGAPEERMREDPLRICRYFRFWADYGSEKPDALILELSARHASRIKHVSERRREGELLKVLMTSRPVPALQFMMETNVLPMLVAGGKTDMLSLQRMLDENPTAGLHERMKAFIGKAVQLN